MLGENVPSNAEQDQPCRPTTDHSLSAVQDNWPELAYTASDLSPYYLHEARDNMSRWRQMRQPKLSMGGWHGSGTRFLQAAAENLPERDESHDVVSPSL